jgi:hypothetical protein
MSQDGLTGHHELGTAGGTHGTAEAAHPPIHSERAISNSADPNAVFEENPSGIVDDMQVELKINNNNDFPMDVGAGREPDDSGFYIPYQNARISIEPDSLAKQTLQT